MNFSPVRRWFRFSLRTFFIVVTLLCVWLGWESHVVRQRRGTLKALESSPAFQFTTADAWVAQYPGGFQAPHAVKISGVRSWLGDEAIQEIWYWPNHAGATESKRRQLQEIFPEATIREIPLEPCHPGCFPANTLVETPDGPRPIQSIQAGDSIISIRTGGETAIAMVQSVFVTDNRLWKISTEDGPLLTTETQPLCLSDMTTRPAGELEPGDTILRSRDGELYPVRVVCVSRTNRLEKVFNLILGDRELFVADGFVARSKPPATEKQFAWRTGEQRGTSFSAAP